MSEVHIRRLTPGDYPELAALWERAGLGTRPLGRDSREEITRQMQQNQVFFLGAEIKGSLRGAVIVTHDGRKGYLKRIAVHPDYRRKGLAKLLTKEAERTLFEKGIKVIELLIEKDNQASIQLARKLGYVEHEDIIYFSKRTSPQD